jgi:hypothetical protein
MNSPRTTGDYARELANRATLLNRRADFDPRDPISNELANAAAEADPVYKEFGSNAPGPLRGEHSRDYQLRVIDELRTHSNRHRNRVLRALEPLPAEAFTQVWNEVLDDAREAAVHWAPPGQLRERHPQRPDGVPVNEFSGDPRVWISHFAAPARAVKRFSNGAGREIEPQRITVG